MSGDVDRAADELVSTHPDADPEDQGTDYEQRRAEWAKLKDSQGRPFNPALHSTHPGGAPKRNRVTGLLQVRRGVAAGQPLGATRAARESETGSRVGAAPQPGPGAPGGVEGAPPRPSAEHYQTAAVLVNSMLLLAVSAGGEEWKPKRSKIGRQTVDEAEQLVESVALYCHARGYSNLPPEWGLVAALGLYVGPRILPKLRETGGVRGLVNRARTWRGRRGARADRGADRQREDDASPGPELPN